MRREENAAVTQEENSESPENDFDTRRKIVGRQNQREQAD